jgi:NADPH2:quinone reductase
MIIEAFGAGPELAQVAQPRPGAGELLVRLHASSVNGFDLSVVNGSVRSWMKYELPVTLGRDFAGVVEAVGPGVTRSRPGDEVYGCYFPPVLKDGTWADYLVVPEDMYVATKPPALSFMEAAALPLAGLAALQLVDAIRPAAGENVLVVGATGGAGGYALQLALSLGARAVATTTPDDAPRVAALGASGTFDFTSGDIVTFVRGLGAGHFQGLIDTVSDAGTVAKLAELMSPGSRIATSTGAADVSTLAGVGIEATNIFATAEPDKLERLGLVAQRGDLTPHLGATYPLEAASEALARFRGGTSGKVGISIV